MEYYDSNNQPLLYKHYCMKMNALLINKEVIEILDKFSKSSHSQDPLERADTFLNLNFESPKEIKFQQQEYEINGNVEKRASKESQESNFSLNRNVRSKTHIATNFVTERERAKSTFHPPNKVQYNKFIYTQIE
jgi:hypothetical protein